MHPQFPGKEERGKQRYGLLLAWAVCIVVDALALGLFVVTLPTYFVSLHQLCTTASCSFGQLSAGAMRTVQTLGLSLSIYAILVITLLIVSELLCVVIAALLLWQKSDNWSALLVAFLLVGLGTSISTTDASVLQPFFGPLLAVFIANFSNFIGAVSLPLLFSLFPNGRFVPRWTRWPVIALIILAIFITVIVPFVPSAPTVFLFLSSIFFTICLLSLVIAQIYRYRRVSTTVEQLQTRWVIFGFSLAALITLGIKLPAFLSLPFSRPDSPYMIFTNLIGPFSLTLPIALCFGIAILRYRLYDIDVLINRSLVYGSLTAILALVYFGSIIALQSLLNVFTGHISTGAQTPVVIVASTLGIVALFQPLRRRLQAVIDRRFYRSKYDAARTLAMFSASLRNEVDLKQLSEQLLTVVQETMQPSHISLWLRDPEQSRERNTRLLPRSDEEERHSL